MKQFLLNIVVLTSFLVSCKNKDIAVNYTSIEDKRSTRIEQLIQHLQNPNEKHIMVVAHRADWRKRSREFNTSHTELYRYGSRYG